MALTKPQREGSSSDSSSGLAERGKVLTAYADVLDFLSMRSYPDGSRRQLGTITLSVEGSQWKACIKCRDTGSVAFVTAITPDELLKLVNNGLGQATLEWREDKYQGGSGKKRG